MIASAEGSAVSIGVSGGTVPMVDGSVRSGMDLRASDFVGVTGDEVDCAGSRAVCGVVAVTGAGVTAGVSTTCGVASVAALSRKSVMLLTLTPLIQTDCAS